MAHPDMIRLVLSHVRSATVAMRESRQQDASDDPEAGTPGERQAYDEGYWTGMGQALSLLLSELGASDELVTRAATLAAFERTEVA